MIERLIDSYDSLLRDTADDDTAIRELAKPFLTDFEINGDSYGVPPITEVVEKLTKKLKHRSRQRDRWKRIAKRMKRAAMYLVKHPHCDQIDCEYVSCRSEKCYAIRYKKAMETVEE